MISISTQLLQAFQLFPLTEQFITQCMEQIKMNPTEYGGNFERMKEYVYQVYLESDIRVTSKPILQPITFEEKERIIDFIILQCDEYTDISNSSDDQLKESKNRMMKLSLTDGKTPIYAIEKEHIHCLSMALKPGFKIALRNVKVRRGIIYLYNNTIQLLGGEVKELIDLEEKRRKELERKYRPSYIPQSVTNHITIPLQSFDDNEDDENED